MNSSNLKDNNQQQDRFDREMKAAFDYFDEDGSGTISKEELERVMKKLGLNPTQVEIQEMLDEIDNEKLGQIDFNAFKKLLTKTINDEFILSSSIDAFNLFDKDKTGKLEKRELVNILQKTCFMEKNDIDLLLSEIDFDENNDFDYNEFVRETFKLLNN